jgi:hypothetical protein
MNQALVVVAILSILLVGVASPSGALPIEAASTVLAIADMHPSFTAYTSIALTCAGTPCGYVTIQDMKNWGPPCWDNRAILYTSPRGVYTHLSIAVGVGAMLGVRYISVFDSSATNTSPSAGYWSPWELLN